MLNDIGNLDILNIVIGHTRLGHIYIYIWTFCNGLDNSLSWRTVINITDLLPITY